MHRRVLLVAFLTIAGCAPSGTDTDSSGQPADITCHPTDPASRSASCVQSFTPGDGAGFGQDDYPDVIYGDPKGGGSHAGSTDVLSLGKGGTIVVGFGSTGIANGEGADFLVFENAFFIGDNPDKPFKELGEVSVSDDGDTWSTFACSSAAYPYTGCAGWNPVYAGADPAISAYDPAAAGGDAFDLADVGLEHARFVRIHDISNLGAGGNAGFDLDAVTLVHPDDR